MDSGQADAVTERVQFMGLDHEAVDRLKAIAPIILEELGPALDQFYARVRSTPETRRFFTSDQQMSGAKSLQQRHWGIIASGDLGRDYAAAVHRIGSTHARIGLEPRWYIDGYAIVLGRLIAAVIEKRWPRRGLLNARSSHASADSVAAELDCLVKVALLDMDLAISVYMEEAEKAKQAAQAEAIETEQKLVSESFGKVMASVAGKDLTCQMAGDLPQAYHALRDDFNASVATLRSALQAVGAVSSSIDSTVGEIDNAAADLSRRTEQQAASVEETAAALEQITATVKNSAQRAEEAGSLVVRTRASAEQSETVVRRAIATMDEIERSSREIGSIIGVIDEIAFQTNLLALNAGVEAARAGEAGKGFAVVAQEVRGLAQRSAEAARQIKALITKSGEEVKSGVALVGDTGVALEAIIADVREISEHVVAIVEASREQSTGLAEINTAVGAIDRGTQQNAAMVEETSAATRNLAGEAEQLNQLLGGFRLGNALAERAQEATPRVLRVSGALPASNAGVRPPVMQTRERAARFASDGVAAIRTQPAHDPQDDGWEEF